MASSNPAQHHFWDRQMQAAPGTPGGGGGVVVPGGQPYIPVRPQVAPSAAESYTVPVSVFSSAEPKGEAVKLYRDKFEEGKYADMYEDMSAVFSVITATERLENIWARRGAISQEDYEQQCEKLIQQYRALRASTEASIPKVDMFIAEYGLKAGKAHARLMAGVPGTVDGPSVAGVRGREQNKFVLRCTTLFHHIVTTVEMEQWSVHMLLPDMTSLMTNLNKVKAVGNGFEFGAVLRGWVERLNGMPAAEELSREQAGQLKLDLDRGFAEFEQAISD